MTDEQLDVALQRAADQQVARCEQYEELIDSLPLELWPPNPASAPYCGCTRCVTREALAGAWPVIEEHVIAPLKHDVRGMFWRGFIAGCAYAIVMTLIGFGLGFMAGWVT